MSDQLMQMYQELEEYMKVLEDFRKRFPEHVNNTIEIAKQEHLDALDTYRAMLNALFNLRALINANELDLNADDILNFSEFLLHVTSALVHLLDKLKSMIETFLIVHNKAINKEDADKLLSAANNYKLLRAALTKIAEKL